MTPDERKLIERALAALEPATWDVWLARRLLRAALGEVAPPPEAEVSQVDPNSPIWDREVSALHERIAELEAEVRQLRAALTEIKHKTGRVCPNFEICKHEPCQSSYTAWQIADTALAGSEDAAQASGESDD